MNPLAGNTSPNESPAPNHTVAAAATGDDDRVLALAAAVLKAADLPNWRTDETTGTSTGDDEEMDEDSEDSDDSDDDDDEENELAKAMRELRGNRRR
jgi:hypothetical protein